MPHPVRRVLVTALVILLVVLMAWPATAAPVSYDVDKGHSALLFRIKHVDVAYTYGRFNDFSGLFVVDEANLAGSSVEITAKLESVDTNDAKRDQHLRSPDFFNVAQFPLMTFKSTTITKSGDDYTVQGNLTLHGVTKALTITMKKTGEGKDPWGNHRIGFEGQMSFKRSDFGMDKLPQAVGDTVWVTVAIEGIRK
jgi:polyisoprenoid-binding protein YceI